MSNLNDCYICRTLERMAEAREIDPFVIGQLRSDHEFAQHAEQINMFEISLVPSEWTGESPDSGIEEAIAAREDGMAKAEGGTPPEFRVEALEAIERAARKYREFLVDEVWDEMPEEWGLQSPNVKGVWMGPIVRGQALKIDGIIESTGRLQPSKNKGSHAGNRTVWRSKIYQPQSFKEWIGWDEE